MSTVAWGLSPCALPARLQRRFGGDAPPVDPMSEMHPNILIIVLDAVRAENFSVLGYDRPTTVHLERHAPSLALYHNAVSAATWTLPSTAGLFTGTLPSTHRLVLDGDRLDTGFVTIAEMLSGRGYFTAKVTGRVPYVSEFSGLDRGFVHVFEPKAPTLRRWRRARKRRRADGAVYDHTGPSDDRYDNGVKQNAAGIDIDDFDLGSELSIHNHGGWQSRLRYWSTGFFDAGAGACFGHVRKLWREHAGRPRFIYLHLQETHAEYRPRHRYRNRFVPIHLRHRNFAAINQRPNPHAVGLVEMTEDDFAILTGLYDGCIAYLDEQIGRLLDDLATLPDFDNTMVVVTADHGDCIGRHGILGHQFVCYDELIRIPWVVKWPARIGIVGEQECLVQNIDLMPTVAAMIGVETPEQCDGLNIVDGRRQYAISELLKPFGMAAVKRGLHEKAPHYDRAVLAVRSPTHKLITYSNAQNDEFFDLRSDGRELDNLLCGRLSRHDSSELAELRITMAGQEPRWRCAVEEIRRRIFGGEEIEIAPEVEQRLRALGYID